MNKPLTMIIKETKTQLANICNESGLSPIILDLIIHGIYSEIHSIAEKQTLEEENFYKNLIDSEEEESANVGIKEE